MAKSRMDVRVNKILYQIGLVTLVTSVLWTSFSIYHALVSPPEVEVKEEVLRPLNPTINEDILDKLSKRFQLNKLVDDYLGGLVIVQDDDIPESEVLIEGGEEATGSTLIRTQGDEESTPSGGLGL